ncbi:MAG: hypothetical protein R3195_19575 [Gemmatimonadota bacterium]|nr:hypothetical protein [Gemmatimonadota bacterium]
MSRFRRSVFASLAVLIALSVAAPAHAYVGPGSFISGLGALIAALAAIGAALFGFLWFPLKRLCARARDRGGHVETAISDAKP